MASNPSIRLQEVDLSAAATASLLVGGAALGLAILAAATARPPGELLGYPEYHARWRELHGLEPHRMARLLGAYYRLPYALARPLARAGVAPNVVTVAGLLVACASLPAYLAGGRWAVLGGVLVLLSGLCDQLDGAVAIMTRRTTAFGAIWDSAVDRVTDFVLLAGPAAWLLRGGGSRAAWATVGLAATAAGLSLLEFVRARCQAVGYVDGQIVTPAERPTRVICLGAAGLVSAVTVWLVTAWGLAVLTAFSVALLLRDAARRATGDGSPSGPATPTR